MEAKDVKKLPWKKVTDWTNLSQTHVDESWFHTTLYVCRQDINIFVETVCRDISRKLKCPYEELKSVIDAENAPFYWLMNRMFHNYSGLGINSSELTILKNTLILPDVEETLPNSVDKCLQLFESLSDTEKLEFLQKVGHIKVEYVTTTN